MFRDGLLAGKRILVTGGGTGLGREIAGRYLALGSWDEWERYVRFLYATGSIDEHTQLWWSVRPHLAYPTVEICICDAQPDLAEARSLAALAYALAARCARAHDEAEPLPDLPHRMLEENLWRALRWGMDRDLIDLRTRKAIPAAQRIRDLLDGCEAEIADRRLTQLATDKSEWLQRQEGARNQIATLESRVSEAQRDPGKRSAPAGVKSGHRGAVPARGEERDAVGGHGADPLAGGAGAGNDLRNGKESWIGRTGNNLKRVERGNRAVLAEREAACPSIGQVQSRRLRFRHQAQHSQIGRASCRERV